MPAKDLTVPYVESKEFLEDFRSGQISPRQALELIYKHHVDMVYRVLVRFGVKEKDADDVTQEFFIRVFRRLHTFEGRSSLKTWIFRICCSMASDYRRSAYKRRMVFDEEVVARQEDTSADAEQTLLAKDIKDTLDQILDTMVPEQREVFVLHDIEGFSGPEIADMLDISLSTVHSRLRLARVAFWEAVNRLEACEKHRKVRLEPSP